jgi:pentatricopeptide repeat protein
MVKRLVVLITGASSGIGKATAKKLVENGYKVYAAARRVALMDDLKKLGAGIIKMDVSNEASMKAGIQQIIDEQGRIDILINNAGFSLQCVLEDVPIADAKMQMEVNLFGPARLIALCLPYMRKNSFGKIVNVSSIMGKMYSPAGSWYTASKHALEGLSDCLRVEVKQFGVDVIIVEPGLIKTAISGVTDQHVSKYETSDGYNNMTQLALDIFNKMQRFGSEPDVIANTILKAIKAKRPKIRYVKGRLSRLSLLAFKVLPDKILDYIYGVQFKKWRD